MKRIFVRSSLALAALLVNCATVPDDAPVELKNANQAIKQAKDADAADTAPKHIDMAEENLDRGVKAFKESEGIATRIDTAKAYGNRSKRLADQAVEMHQDVKAWDQDGEIFRDFKAARERVEQLENELAAVSKQREELGERKMVDVPVTTISASGNLMTGAAWFETNSSNPSLIGQQNIQRIVNALEEDEELTVTVIGFADRRGAAAHNRQLSERRARAVAERLKAAGVDQNRIQVVAKGAESSATSAAAVDLQMDRRVDLELIKTAH